MGSVALHDVGERRTHRGGSLIRPLLETSQREPTRSELEDAFLSLIRRHNLPIPRINIHVAGYRVDAVFPDHRLVIELDGWATHKTRQAFARDRRQDADILAATGMPTVRLVYEDTAARHDATARRLAAILGSRT